MLGAGAGGLSGSLAVALRRLGISFSATVSADGHEEEEEEREGSL